MDSVKFKYVPSLQNPSNLTTRRLSFDKFKQNFKFWISGPTWLMENPVARLESSFSCLNDKSNLVQHYINTGIDFIGHVWVGSSERAKKDVHIGYNSLGFCLDGWCVGNV